MRLQLFPASLVVFLCAALGGAETAGRLTCAGPVKLSGTLLPVEEIPSWPVVRGDTIETLSEPAFLVLMDRTRIVIAENSRVSFSGDNAAVRVRLLKGELSYKLSPEGSTSIYDGETELPALPAGEAHVQSGNGRVDPPNGKKETKPPPHERSRSASAPGHNK
jgi:hypothetical protein